MSNIMRLTIENFVRKSTLDYKNFKQRQISTFTPSNSNNYNKYLFT